MNPQQIEHVKPHCDGTPLLVAPTIDPGKRLENTQWEEMFQSPCA
jgi:hypothetical protein